MRSLAVLLMSISFVLFLGNIQAAEVSFKKHVINADSVAESAGVLDVNRDGVLDILSGDSWYE